MESSEKPAPKLNVTYSCHGGELALVVITHQIVEQTIVSLYARATHYFIIIRLGTLRQSTQRFDLNPNLSYMRLDYKMKSRFIPA